MLIIIDEHTAKASLAGTKKGVTCLCRQRGSAKTRAENKKQSTPVADMIIVFAFLLLVKICYISLTNKKQLHKN